MTEIVGTLATSRIASGDKYRVTWTWTLANIPLVGFLFDAPYAANNIRNWLPSVGFVPVSNPSALKGDFAIVFDVRPAATMAGKTIADAVVLLEQAPVAATDVTRFAKLGIVSGSAELEQQQANDRETAVDRAVSWDNWLASLGSILQTTAGVVAVVAVVGVVAFVVYSTRKK